MKKVLFRYITVSLAVLILLAFQTWNVAAQVDRTEAELPYKELVIQLMPEYVNPSGWTEEGPVLLYGQHGFFLNEGEEIFVGDITVDAPVNEPSLFIALVGRFDEQGQVQELDYTIDEDAGTIQWTPEGGIAPGEEYRYVIEYYYAPFTGESLREFSFDFTLDRQTENMTVLFFEPYGAEDITLSKDPERVTDMFGVPVHAFEFEDLSAGEIFALDISYVKDNEISTLEALESQRPPNDETHAGIGGNPGVPGGGNNPIISTENAVMISISLIISGLLVFFGLRTYRQQPAVQQEKGKFQKQAAKVDIQAEKKILRQQFMNGEIDEKTYRNRMMRLSS